MNTVPIQTIIETMFGKYFTDTKMDTKEYRKHINEILEYLPEEFSEEVKNALNDRNRLSLRMRLEKISIYSKNEDEYNELIPDIIKFRNNIAHGRGLENFTIEAIVKMHDIMKNIFNNFVLEIITKTDEQNNSIN